jgi:hypothetical protein
MADSFKILDEGDIQTKQSLITSGLFQDGAGSISTFHTSSTQFTNTGDYSVDMYRYDPASNASASVQFGVTYGHRGGSGSLGTKSVAGDRTTAAVFGQFNNLINPAETIKFKFSDGTSEKTDVQHFYAISINRARLREELEPGGWEIHLGTGVTKVKLIDDSSTNTGGNTDLRNFAPEYNIVSGTLVGGTTIKSDVETISGASGSYGLVYPSLGILMLNPERLMHSPLSLNITTGSNTAHYNHISMSNQIKLGAYFSAKRQERIVSTHYFIRAKASNFNATTNATYFTESTAGTRTIIAGLTRDPKTFITTVGLYNNEDDLLAIAKLSKPIIKSDSREALIKVKLDF